MDLNQSIILGSAERLAKHGSFDAARYFGWLDESLEPRLSTVAMPVRGNLDGPSVFGGGQRIELGNLQALFGIISDFPRLYYKNLAPDVQGLIWQMRVDAKKALQASIDEVLSPTDGIAFVSLPLFSEDLCVFAVLELSRARVCSFYTMPGESH